MAGKEQIMIHGCNVLKCRYFQYKTLKDCEMRYPESGDCEIGLLNYLFNGNLDMEKLCIDNPNCNFKQLARKTQEYEQKDKEINELRQENEKLVEWQKTVARLFDRTCRCQFLDEDTAICKENGKECISIVGCRDRYRKALEEIEEYVKSQFDGFGSDVYAMNKVAINEILNIINKAKGGSNER